MATILYSVENAMTNFLVSGSAASGSLISYFGDNFYQGMNNIAVEAPCVISIAESATEDFKEGYVWHVRTNVMVKVIAADLSNETADLYADTVFETICDPNTITTLGTYSSTLTVYDIIVESMDRAFDGDAWVTMLSLDIVCVNNS